ncbi:NitT/TauT family transport system permease protein [termite gut metagenome]|uniref:NitT/TauT family transport system permease protein n=1 Tax=termite gut metagenome TaxID=433724 RepID=A0A5J4SPM0_9ZZZZ
MKRIRIVIVNMLLGTLLVNLFWFAAAHILHINVLPNPFTVYARLGDVWQRGMSIHLFASLWRMTAGIFIAALIGTITALWMVQSRIIGKLLGAFVYFVYPIPKLALLPVVMLLAGLGDVAKVVMIVLIILFQIIVNVRDSLKNIPRESFLIVTSLGAKQWDVFLHVILPAILPDLLSTLRVAVGTAISVLFVTETYGTNRGMGYFIVDAWMRINYIDMYAGIIILSMTGFLLFLSTDLLEAWLCKWRGNISD